MHRTTLYLKAKKMHHIRKLLRLILNEQLLGYINVCQFKVNTRILIKKNGNFLLN
jgi:hypothetical protein